MPTTAPPFSTGQGNCHGDRGLEKCHQRAQRYQSLGRTASPCGSATSVAPGIDITFSFLQVFRIHQHYSICNGTARSEMHHGDRGDTLAGSGNAVAGLGDTMAGSGDMPLGWGETAGRRTHTVRVRGHAGSVRGECTGRVWGDTSTVKGRHAPPLHSHHLQAASCGLGETCCQQGPGAYAKPQQDMTTTPNQKSSTPNPSPNYFLSDSPAHFGMRLPATEVPFLPSRTHRVHHVDVVHKISLPKVDSELQGGTGCQGCKEQNPQGPPCCHHPLGSIFLTIPSITLSLW